MLFGKNAVRAGKDFMGAEFDTAEGAFKRRWERRVDPGGTNLAAGLAEASRILEKLQEERDALENFVAFLAARKCF